MLKILKDKKHLAYKETLKWAGKKFDPVYFDKEGVNKKLLRLDEYIHNWLNS